MTVTFPVPEEQGRAWLAGRLSDLDLFWYAGQPAGPWYLWIAWIRGRADLVAMLRQAHQARRRPGFAGILWLALHDRVRAWSARWAETTGASDRYFAFDPSSSFWTIAARA